MYRNNQGPFIITLPDAHLDIPNNDSFRYEHNEVTMNVEYKFAILALVINGSERLFSDIQNYVKVKLTPPGLEVEHVKDFTSKITCNADGSFTLKNSRVCTPEVDVVQAKTINYNGTEEDFDYDTHDMLMRDITNSPKIILDF